MERLSGLDAFFLYLEAPTQPLNVCCVLQLDATTMPGGYTYGRLREALALRVNAVPEFVLKLADSQLNFDFPVWVNDEDFDLDRHLHRVGVPSPGGDKELAEICGHIAAQPLDRAHPLWEMWVIDHFDGKQTLAIVLKAHHAVVDGVGGANLLAQLTSLAPDAPPPESIAPAKSADPLQIAVSGLFGVALRPWRFAQMVPSTVATVAKTIRRARSGGHTMAAPFAAPPTPFNGLFSRRRTVAFADLDLREVKAIKNRFGITINDVVTALCAGALRRLLSDRDALPDSSLVASVPISVRDECDRHGRNQTTWMFCRLYSQIDDPAERLRLIARGNAAAKDHAVALGPTLLHDWTEMAGQTMFGTAMKLLPHVPLTAYNLVMSNVPGPQEQLYFLGCKVNGMYPLGPIIAGVGLNITVMSLNGRLGVGIVTCPDLGPDVWDLADAFPAALEELLECARRRRPEPRDDRGSSQIPMWSARSPR